MEYSKTELLQIITSMIDDIERLPSHAKLAPLTNYDMLSILLLMQSIVERCCADVTDNDDT